MTTTDLLQRAAALDAADPLARWRDEFHIADPDLAYLDGNSLGMPPARIYGVATFYHYFRLKPPGRHTFVLCQGTACYVKGAPALQQAVERRCGVRFGQTTGDGRVSLLTARCVGSCGLAPVAVVDEQMAPKLSEADALARLERWLTEPEPAP